MQVVRLFQAISNNVRPVYCAIGMFDGVHLGHQLLLKHVVKKASANSGIAVALTFREHPTCIVAPERAPGMIYGTQTKELLFEALGIDLAWVIPFDRTLSLLSASDFITQIRQYSENLAGICVGKNFVFGHERTGNIHLLEQLGGMCGFEVEAKNPVTCGGDSISSTRIRDLIGQGNFKGASRLLGRTYHLSGTVVRGEGLGKHIGFPTANMHCPQLKLPPSGVYAISAVIQGERRNGVMNIGLRPTLRQPQPRLQIEAHFLELDTDLYGERLDVEFIAKLRSERKFPNLETLTEQIHADINMAKECF